MQLTPPDAGDWRLSPQMTSSYDNAMAPPLIDRVLTDARAIIADRRRYA